jgi:hypothetical protein
MSPLENVKRLYLDYLNAGFKKDVIARKLKSQFPGAKFTFKGATLYVAFGLNPEQKVLGMELNAAQRLQVTASDYHKLKELAKKFEQQLKKEGAPGVEVTFISDDEINIFSEDKHAFDKAKQVLKKVPGLTFSKEDVDNDPDFDGPQYHAWYKF